MLFLLLVCSFSFCLANAAVQNVPDLLNTVVTKKSFSPNDIATFKKHEISKENITFLQGRLCFLNKQKEQSYYLSRNKKFIFTQEHKRMQTFYREIEAIYLKQKKARKQKLRRPRDSHSFCS